ncbi:secreted RxLR effector protein 161-like [Quercus lobata]|uniref:secreted RxLR effector protein 161-like n=1 Tax=Quercus lobata TaxID=97700 RepID=UPI0012439B88|nr:secreted RxLR effector protein 161-like [Quercus lobata]
MARVSYANAVGSLMYGIMCTRPDICYAVGFLNRFQSNSGLAPWKAVKRILRYLKGTTDYVLCYQGSNLRKIGYSDADWGSDLDDCKFTSRYAFLLNKGTVTWSSKKQSFIALSTVEAKYVTCLAVVQEAVWNHEVVEDALNLVTVHCDSMSALAYANDSKYHGKTKHIDIRYHYIREIVAHSEVVLKHISSRHMIVDPQIKPIGRDAF